MVAECACQCLISESQNSLSLKHVSKTILLLLTVACSYNSLCQDAEIFKPDSIRKEIDAVQIAASLHIDGLMNEPEWKLVW